MSDTEINIVHFTHLIELAVVGSGEGGCMVFVVNFTMKASPLPPPLPVSAIEMNMAQLT